MSDRLTRKEMKRRDRFQLAMTSSLDWIQEHRKQIVLGVVVVVVAVAAAVAWTFWQASREDDAQALLNDAIEAYGAPVGDQAADDSTDQDGPHFATDQERLDRATELFDQVRDRYGSSDAADIAEVYLGQIAEEKGDADRARELWQDYLDSSPSTALAADVRLNLFALDRANGRAEQVATELEGMLARETKPLPGDVILYELATTLEQLGRDQEATERYQQLIKEYETSPYVSEARSKLAGAGAVPGASPTFQMPS